MNLLKPNIYNKDIYSINYQKIKDNNIKCLLFDLDNTIATLDDNQPSKETIKLFNELKRMDFSVYIFSNALPKRVEPFRRTLKVIGVPFALKPLKRNFKRMLKTFKKEEIAIIGDQIFTDVFGGNKVGITTILVDPISKKDLIITKIFRFLEKLVKRGDYHE